MLTQAGYARNPNAFLPAALGPWAGSKAQVMAKAPDNRVGAAGDALLPRPRCKGGEFSTCYARWSSQPVDTPQDVGEDVAGQRDLAELEGNGAGVADHFGADLDQLLGQHGQPPLPHS